MTRREPAVRRGLANVRAEWCVTCGRDTRVNLGRGVPERVAVRLGRVGGELLQQRVVRSLVRAFVAR